MIIYLFSMREWKSKSNIWWLNLSKLLTWQYTTKYMFNKWNKFWRNSFRYVLNRIQDQKHFSRLSIIQYLRSSCSTTLQQNRYSRMRDLFHYSLKHDENTLYVKIIRHLFINSEWFGLKSVEKMSICHQYG